MTTTALGRSAQQQVDSQTAALQTEITTYVAGREGSTGLRSLLEHLCARPGARDELVSRALAGMLSRGELILTPEREVKLPSR